MKWEDFKEAREKSMNRFMDARQTDIECPECGKKIYVEKIETLYKSANTFLEGYLKFIRGKKNEHSDNTRQTNARP